MKLSVFWIVKNEENNLPRSIESLRAQVDEMVVVDTGSTDRTVELAKELGARVEHFIWINDFAAARNYALQLVTGDVVLMMDADEWFQPVFGAAERKHIDEIFSDPRVDVGLLRRTDLDADTGLGKGFITLWRFFRRAHGFHYEGKIHEVLVSDDGRPVQSKNTGLNIDHGGYNETVMGGKLERNIQMLEDTVADPETPPAERAKFRAYLVREYTFQENRAKAFEHFMVALRDPETPRILEKYTMLAAQYSVLGMELGRTYRGQVSRREIHDKLLAPFRKMLPREEGGQLLPLVYDVCFAPRYDRLAERIEREIVPGKISTEGWGNDLLRGALAVVCSKQAEFAWRRDKADMAFDYALATLQVQPERQQTVALRILLLCMQSQPEADQILLLRNIFDTDHQMKLTWLVKDLCRLNGGMLYLYFFKQQFERGWASKTDYFYVQLLQGRRDEMVQALQQPENEVPPEVAADMLLLAVATGGKELVQQYPEMMAGNKRMAEALAAGTVLDAPTDWELGRLTKYHSMVMHLSPEAGAAFRAIFAQRPEVQFYCKTVWCVDTGRYAEMAPEDLPADTRLGTPQQNDMVYCLMLSGRYAQALQRVEAMLQEEAMDDDSFNNLLTIVEMAGGEGSARARTLYEAEWPLWDEYTDLRDVVNTGVVYDDVGKKGEKGLAGQTVAQWKKSMAGQAKTDNKLYLETWQAAAGIYEQKGYLGMAQRCLAFLAANGYQMEATVPALAEVWRKLGNAAVAAEVEKME